MNLYFGNPPLRFVALAVVVVLAVAYALDRERRRRVLERIGHLPQLQRLTSSLSPGRRVLKAILLTAGVTLAVAALARPQTEGETQWRQRGIDIVLVMDFSKSMLARDVFPTRAERAKLVAEQLLRADELGGARFGAVVFAGAAAHFPLSQDHEAAATLFRDLTPLDLPPGSDIGEAIATARCIVRPDLPDEPECVRVGGRGRGGAPLVGDDDEQPKVAPPANATDRARVIVVLTDGEDTEDRARAEVERAAQIGIDVYFVGIGTPSGELIPELDRAGNEIGWKKTDDGKSFVTTRLEEGSLKQLADIAGGPDHYERVAARTLGTSTLVGKLDRLKKGDLDLRVVKKRREDFQWLLFPAYLLLVIEACIGERRREKKREPKESER